MMPVRLCHIIQIFPRLCRKNGTNRLYPRASHRSGRKAFSDIRIIRRIDPCIGYRKLRFIFTQSILHCRINLERHILLQTCENDGGNRFLIFLKLCLPLHHRRYRDKGIHRQIFSLCFFPQSGRKHFIGPFIHKIADLFRCIILGNFIRIGK